MPEAALGKPGDTRANRRNRAQVGELARHIQEATGDSVEAVLVDQGFTGDELAAAEAHDICLGIVKQPTAKRSFVRGPRRWVFEQ